MYPTRFRAAALPKGFRYASAACGLRRKNRLDLGLIVMEEPAAAAGIFTQNLAKAVARSALPETHQSRGRPDPRDSGEFWQCELREWSIRHARVSSRPRKPAAKALRCKPEQILVCSTGVIGIPLPVEKILAALPELPKSAAALPANYDGLTQAILTTDTSPKWAAAQCRIGGKHVRLTGLRKGRGDDSSQYGHDARLHCDGCGGNAGGIAPAR